tara:strand:+ start:132 stop:629 length:498 start_codon:yes stop_codon:yes gene_type:complete
MIIPVLNELRKESRIEKNKSNKKKLDEILKYRNERRKGWSQDKINKYNKFLIELKKAHDNYVNALQKEIISKTKYVIKVNPNSKGFNLEDPQFIEADIGKFSENTIYKGLWDKKKKKYSRISHIEAGIDLTPFEEVKFIFMGFGSGYTLTDTSNKYKTQITVNLD